MISSLEYHFYGVFEVSLNGTFQDNKTLFIEKRLLDILNEEVSQVVKQPPREFWLSKANTQRNLSLTLRFKSGTVWSLLLGRSPIHGQPLL